MKLSEYLSIIPEIPAFLTLFNDISATIKDPSEAHLQQDAEDLKPLILKHFPNASEEKIDAIFECFIALTTLRTDHSTHTCEVVAGTIVHNLPHFGLPLTQEHADALVIALADALSDFGVK